MSKPTRTEPSAKAKETKRIFIVDDHPVFREGVAALIHRAPELEVCGEADNAQQAFAAVEKLKPDLVLVDIGLPGKSGLELVHELHATAPGMFILAISMFEELLYAERVLRAGGRGYIMKQEGPEKVFQAIRHVLGGQVYLSEKMSGSIIDSLSGHGKKPNAIGALSDRELEILRLVGHGHDSHDIARQLNLSFKTVDSHRGHIKQKLNFKSGTELICFAARWVATQSPADFK
jgi:DNA-binding NarL/FixJ family response regulator